MADERRIRADLEIRALKCPDGLPFVEQSLRDPRLPGLKIRVYRSDRKVFFLVYRVNREKKCLKLGVYNPPNFGLAAARAKASAELAAITNGENPVAELNDARRAADVRGLYEEFEKEVVKRFPLKTRANWNGTSRRFLTEIGSLPVTATDEICDRVMALHKRIGFDEGKETLAHTLFKHASRFFRWAIQERKLKPSQFPLSGMRSRFKDKKRTRYYDPAEVWRLLKATNDSQTWWPEGVEPNKVIDRDRDRAAIHRAYFLLLWHVGCRRGALASMHWDEIKPDHVTRDRWLWYRATSKNNDPLEIPLSSYATKILDELKEITGGKGSCSPPNGGTEQRVTARTHGSRWCGFRQRRASATSRTTRCARRSECDGWSAIHSLIRRRSRSARRSPSPCRSNDFGRKHVGLRPLS
jgi:integrase